MSTKEFLFLGAVIYIGWRYQRSHQSRSAVDQAYLQDAQTFASMAGSNFTQSNWDPVSGQPTYMWGATPVALQGGLSVQANSGVGSIFGHIA
ncbi:hypothetical protein AWB76_04082 [Caballeronia temeraria]|uniref:Uncharacterized protein n=1 Tax=Caballeronia temeraria TaxID=1777137 RepID=A0A158BES6_9BURK|nr:hypothetical protein [Caballeronia temeraria]SAK68286.1 hypothetical protein AWB76_04082 [Caballeronia temeraria]